MEKRILFVVKNLYTMERLGPMLLSSLATARGWETDLYIADLHPAREFDRKLATFQPVVIAYSVMTPEFPAVDALARRAHARGGAFNLFGGPHPTFFQEILEQPHVHGLAFGEGDVSFPEFLERFEQGRDFTGTPGMHFHLNGKLHRNAPAPLEQKLDRLPFADRGLMEKGDPLLAGGKTHIFIASRGCPNACTYCFNHQFNRMFRSCGRILRHRSADNLLREMKAVKEKQGLDFAYIDDDILTLLPLAWLEEFADRYPAEVGAPFLCNVHANFVNDEKIDCLARAGCRTVCFGLECGDESVAANILKRKVENRRYLALAQSLHGRGLRVMTQNILALPVPRPLSTDLQTLDVNLACRPDFAVSQLFFPLPGTDLAAYSAANGFLPGGLDRLPERTNSYSALHFPDRREKARVQRLHKLFGLTVRFRFLRPLVPFLIRLPLGAVYSLFYVLWYGYATRIKLEGTRKSGRDFRFFWRSLCRNIAAFVRKPSRKLD